jgi:hypothetical protein
MARRRERTAMSAAARASGRQSRGGTRGSHPHGTRAGSRRSGGRLPAEPDRLCEIRVRSRGTPPPGGERRGLTPLRLWWPTGGPTRGSRIVDEVSTDPQTTEAFSLQHRCSAPSGSERPPPSEGATVGLRLPRRAAPHRRPGAGTVARGGRTLQRAGGPPRARQHALLPPRSHRPHAPARGLARQRPHDDPQQDPAARGSPLRRARHRRQDLVDRRARSRRRGPATGPRLHPAMDARGAHQRSLQALHRPGRDPGEDQRDGSLPHLLEGAEARLQPRGSVRARHPRRGLQLQAEREDHRRRRLWLPAANQG